MGTGVVGTRPVDGGDEAGGGGHRRVGGDVRRHLPRAAPKLVRAAYLIVRSRHVAEELVHDGFVRLHQNFDDVESPGGFLHTVVVRLCLTWLKRRTWSSSGSQRLARRRRSPQDPRPEDADEMWAALAHVDPERRRSWCCGSTRTCPTSGSPRSSSARSGRCAAASIEGWPTCGRRSSDERRTTIRPAGDDAGPTGEAIEDEAQVAALRRTLVARSSALLIEERPFGLRLGPAGARGRAGRADGAVDRGPAARGARRTRTRCPDDDRLGARRGPRRRAPAAGWRGSPRAVPAASASVVVGLAAGR